MDLPDTYEVFNTFNIGDLQRYEENTELRTILLKGRDDTCTDTPQAKPNYTTNAPDFEDFYATGHEGFLHGNHTSPKNNGPMNISQEQEDQERKEGGWATQSSQPQSEASRQTEYRAADQPSKQSTWKSREHAQEWDQLREPTSIHGPSNQGPRTVLMIHTESSSPATKTQLR